MDLGLRGGYARNITLEMDLRARQSNRRPKLAH